MVKVMADGVGAAPPLGGPPCADSRTVTENVTASKRSNCMTLSYRETRKQVADECSEAPVWRLPSGFGALRVCLAGACWIQIDRESTHQVAGSRAGNGDGCFRDRRAGRILHCNVNFAAGCLRAERNANKEKSPKQLSHGHVELIYHISDLKGNETVRGLGFHRRLLIRAHACPGCRARTIESRSALSLRFSGSESGSAARLRSSRGSVS